MASRLSKLGSAVGGLASSAMTGMVYGTFGTPGLMAMGAAGSAVSSVRNILHRDAPEQQDAPAPRVVRSESPSNSILEKILQTLQSIESSIAGGESISPGVPVKRRESQAEKFERIQTAVNSGEMSPQEAVQSLVTRKYKNVMAEEALSKLGVKTDDKNYAALKKEILQGIENELGSETGIQAVWEELQKSNTFLEEMAQGNEETQFEAENRQEELISAIKDLNKKPEEGKKPNSFLGTIFSALSSLGSVFSNLFDLVKGFIPKLSELIPNLSNMIPLMSKFFGKAGAVGIAGAVGYWIGGQFNEWFEKEFGTSVGSALYDSVQKVRKALGMSTDESDLKTIEAKAKASAELKRETHASIKTQSELEKSGMSAAEIEKFKNGSQGSFTKNVVIPKEIENDGLKIMEWLTKQPNINLAQRQEITARAQKLLTKSNSTQSSNIETQKAKVEDVKQSVDKGSSAPVPVVNVQPTPVVVQQSSSSEMPAARNPDNSFLRNADRMYVLSML